MRTDSMVGPVIGVACVIVLSNGLACSSSMNDANQLDESLRAYHHHLLAGDLDRATAYVSTKAMDEFLAIHGDEEDPVTIEDFQILSVRFVPPGKDDKEPKKAIVLVGADIRKHDSITMKAVRYRQEWEQHGQRWILGKESIAKKRGSERGTADGDDPPKTAPEAETNVD